MSDLTADNSFQWLTNRERAVLQQQEAIIQRGIKKFLEVGQALLTIRDGRLYRADYATFEEYCRTRWGFSKTSANRFIAAQDVMKNIIDVDAEIRPTSESQIRPLTALKTPEEQQRVWKLVVKEVRGNRRPLTANIITRKVAEVSSSAHQSLTKRPIPRYRKLRFSDIEVMLEDAFKRDAKWVQSAKPTEVLKWLKHVFSKHFEFGALKGE